MQATQLNIGIIGLGIGYQHLLACLEHKAVGSITVCDFDKEKCTRAAKENARVEIAESAEDILRAKNISLVIIASYEQFHAEQVLVALEQGKHVFCEKPFCLSRTHAEQIEKALQEKPELYFSSHYILRRYPVFEKLKKQIQSGTFGELFCLEGDYNYGRIEKITEGWRSKEPFYSVTASGGLHLIDLLLWLSGKKVQHVYAVGTKKATQGSAFQFLDTVLASLSFTDGSIGKVCSHFGCMYPHTHRLSLYGTKGSFEKSLPGAFAVLSRDAQAQIEPYSEYADKAAKGKMVSEFISAIVDKTAVPIAYEELFHGMSVCLAVEESLVQNRPIALQ